MNVTEQNHLADIWAWANQKGGVSKTTSTLHVANNLALSGRRVLLIDTDGQANTTYTVLGSINRQAKGTLYESYHPGFDSPIEGLIQQGGHENLFIVPGTTWMTSLEKVLDQPFRLKQILEPIRPYYHVIIIDTPPNLEMLTLNAIIAATDIWIPTVPRTYALVGMSILTDTLKQLNEKYNKEGVSFDISGVLITQVRYPLSKAARSRIAQIQDHFGEKVLKTIIPLNEKVEESNDQAMPPYLYAPDAKGIQAYVEATKEMIRIAERRKESQ
jgi:chromosome partitioning protein